MDGHPLIRRFSKAGVLDTSQNTRRMVFKMYIYIYIYIKLVFEDFKKIIIIRTIALTTNCIDPVLCGNKGLHYMKSVTP